MHIFSAPVGAPRRTFSIDQSLKLVPQGITTSTVPYGAKTPPQHNQGQHDAEEPPISSGSLPPPSGNGRGLQSDGASCSSSVVRIRELEAQLARRKAQATRDRVAADEAAEARLRQGRIDADAADIVAYEAELAYEIARSHASSHTRSEMVHAGPMSMRKPKSSGFP